MLEWAVQGGIWPICISLGVFVLLSLVTSIRFADSVHNSTLGPYTTRRLSYRVTLNGLLLLGCLSRVLFLALVIAFFASHKQLPSVFAFVAMALPQLSFYGAFTTVLLLMTQLAVVLTRRKSLFLTRPLTVALNTAFIVATIVTAFLPSNLQWGDCNPFALSAACFNIAALLVALWLTHKLWWAVLRKGETGLGRVVAMPLGVLPAFTVNACYFGFWKSRDIARDGQDEFDVTWGELLFLLLGEVVPAVVVLFVTTRRDGGGLSCLCCCFGRNSNHNKDKSDSMPPATPSRFLPFPLRPKKFPFRSFPPASRKPNKTSKNYGCFPTATPGNADDNHNNNNNEDGLLLPGGSPVDELY